jgi:hypothetical protein
MFMVTLPAAISGEEVVTRPHIDDHSGPQDISIGGETFTNHGLVGTAVLPAGTIDFRGDTLGSFSSLQIAPGSWRRVGDGYEGVMWTLPDRGRNDPAANIFFDYAARLIRYHVRFTPRDGRFSMMPDGGLTLRDYRGRPFTGADPGTGTISLRGMTLPAPASGVGRGKIALDAESLQFDRAGNFYVGDEYAANIYYFDRHGRLRGVIQPPAAVTARRDGRLFYGSLEAPDSGRRNNQGVEGMSLSPDGHTLFVVLQSALLQDSATGNAAGRVNTRILVYDVTETPTPARPVGHYVVRLPAYNDQGHGGPPNRTAAQSEIRALDGQRFLMLARDGAGQGADNGLPVVYKSLLLVDVTRATNMAGTEYETGTASLLRDRSSTELRPEVTAATAVEFINMLNPSQLARFGLSVSTLSEKWEAVDLVSALDADHPHDRFLLIGNDNDFVARHCRMTSINCDSATDNDSRILVYRVTLPN